MQNLPKLWFSFQGRASRSDYWVRFVFLSLVLLIVAYFADAFAGTEGTIIMVWQVAILWPAFAVGVKRFHDRGKSGRSFVYLECALLALMLVATFAAAPVKLAQESGMQPPSLYVSVMFAATLASLVLLIYLIVALGIRKGVTGPNQYGPDPLGASAPPL
ncbi:MAG: hypothetical protein JWM77_4318 [Rhodospirillales bacterium]|nr:hypothetical protein [Rhodospirillales bacterium]